MPVQTAVQAHAQRSANCAQAILHGFRETHGVSDEQIRCAASHGGGRAPGGLCGALHSALELADGPDAKQQIRDEFERQAGAVTCREVRALRKLSCQDCVRVAAELLHERQAGR